MAKRMARPGQAVSERGKTVCCTVGQESDLSMGGSQSSHGWPFVFTAKTR